ncbi:MAG: TonB-dependent receptor, partial [Bacteroidetes bacterium]|nr:TonB-dependent receptor [Bacteroidota bacterium]
MLCRRLSCVCILLTLWGVQVVFAQQAKPLNASFSNASFDAFVQKIESQSDYHFYYDPAELDSFRVSIVISNRTLGKVLDSLFSGTAFHYAIDAGNRVFITRRFAINPQLPAGFFSPSGSNEEKPVRLPSEEKTTEPDKLKASAENKLYEIGVRGGKTSGANATLAGYIRDGRNGEAIIGASVYIDTPSVGAVSDQYGYYSLNLPRGR